MKLTSNVDGVHWSPSHLAWISRTPGKKQLYRGPDQQVAEMARLEWDWNAKTRQPQAKTPTCRDPFKNVTMLSWPATEAQHGLEQSYEI